jgi:hypothetical protein
MLTAGTERISSDASPRFFSTRMRPPRFRTTLPGVSIKRVRDGSADGTTGGIAPVRLDDEDGAAGE